MAGGKAGVSTDLHFQIESDFKEESLTYSGINNVLDFKNNTFFYYSDVQKCFYVQQLTSNERTGDEKIQVFLVYYFLLSILLFACVLDFSFVAEDEETFVRLKKNNVIRGDLGLFSAVFF